MQINWKGPGFLLKKVLSKAYQVCRVQCQGEEGEDEPVELEAEQGHRGREDPDDLLQQQTNPERANWKG